VTPSAPEAARAAAERAVRAAYGRLVALLAARSRDLAAAEDALSEALRAALETWPLRGVPDRPEAWLMTAAKRAAGHARARAATATAALPDLTLIAEEASAMPDAFPDHRLGLMFACTHPAIDPATQTPLMLQAVLGLSAERIAGAFLISPATMGQRLSRAKSRLREAGARFARPDPDEIAPRLPQVMEAVLAAAALGWEAVPGSDPARTDLAAEALYLAELLADLTSDQPEPKGLLSLLLHIRAREPGRTGRYLPLIEQSTGLWDHQMIDRADRLLAEAGAMGRFGRFQCEAAIQSVHSEGARRGRTNWPALATLHAALDRLSPSLGGTVAAAAVTLELEGPAAALAALDALPEAEAFQPWWALRAEVLARMGDRPGQAGALRRAMGLTGDAGLREWLAARLAQASQRS
jgi:RNA polymerase sigma-70 factor (ECF subfamily)